MNIHYKFKKCLTKKITYLSPQYISLHSTTTSYDYWNKGQWCCECVKKYCRKPVRTCCDTYMYLEK